MCDDDAGAHRQHQHAEDDGEGEGCGYLDTTYYLEQHLDADEAEDDAQTVFQVFEILGNGSEGKIEGTESENGEDVRREHDKRIAADGEYGGD